MIASLVTLAAVFVVLLGAGLAWRGGRRARSCPDCGVALEVVAAAGSGPNATYDVLACPTCPTTRALAQGSLRALAFCPRCRHRTLEVLTARDDGGAIEVHERCALCSHERAFAVAPPAIDDAPRPLGKVIPFPRRTPPAPRRRDADGAS